MTEQKAHRLSKHISVIYELVYDQYHGLLRHRESRMLHQHRSAYARMFGHMLFDVPTTFTGHISIQLLELKLSDFFVRGTPEHFMSRQRGGDVLLDLISRSASDLSPPTYQQVSDIVVEYSHVHYVTKEENGALRLFQQNCSSEAAYNRAGVVLVEAGELFTYRGRKTASWRASMIQKYKPTVDAYYSTDYIEQTQVPHIEPNVLY